MSIITKKGFPKTERLKSTQQIDLLFREGKSFFAPPVKCYYRMERPDALAKVTQKEDFRVRVKAGVSVSKRNFKKATDRNRIKRLMREAYRLHKAHLFALVHNREEQLEIFLVYTDKSMPVFALLEEKIKYSLRRLIRIVEGTP